ncbi:MAG TPA: hypothetical protein VJ184_10595, partial [Chryseolinea sp.]|nr:hypothetical protein [Chryseolinea sp.]
MAEEKLIRLSQAARKLNVGHNTILDFLLKKGFEVENNPNAKLTPEQVTLLSKEFASSATEKLEASGLSIGVKHSDSHLETEKEVKKRIEDEETNIMIKNLGSKDLKVKEEPKLEKVEREKPKLEGIKVVGKIELEKKPVTKEEEVPEEPKVVIPTKSVEKEIPVEIKKEEPKPKPEPPPAPIEIAPIPEKQPEQELIKARADKLQGLKVVDR